MQNKRKLLIALITIFTYTLILITKNYDPLALGGGFATFLATIMFGYYGEYKHK